MMDREKLLLVAAAAVCALLLSYIYGEIRDYVKDTREHMVLSTMPDYAFRVPEEMKHNSR